MHNRSLVGRITVVQEQRFRLTTEDGRSFLFILDRKSPVQLPAVYRLREFHTLVRTEYSGEPNTSSGIAHVMQPSLVVAVEYPVTSIQRAALEQARDVLKNC